jgi:hypothetical protein
VGCFSRGRPSSAPTPAYSRARSQPVTIPLTARTCLSAPVSRIPSPAPADPHHRRDSGQTATRASGQGCLMPPRPILSLLADDRGPYRHLTSAAPSPFCCSVVPSLHSRDASAWSSTARPRATHPPDGAGTTKGVSSRPQRSPTGVRTWPPRCGALVHLLMPRGHRSAHPVQRG